MYRGRPIVQRLPRRDYLRREARQGREPVVDDLLLGICLAILAPHVNLNSLVTSISKWKSAWAPSQGGIQWGGQLGDGLASTHGHDATVRAGSRAPLHLIAGVLKPKVSGSLGAKGSGSLGAKLSGWSKVSGRYFFR